MRLLAILFLLSLLILSGCSHEDEMRFTKGTGDMGNFLVEHALKLGAHSLSTNGLPKIGGEWHYSEDQYGVVFQLPRERFSEVETFYTKLSALQHKSRPKRPQAENLAGILPKLLELHCNSASTKSKHKLLSSDHSQQARF